MPDPVLRLVAARYRGAGRFAFHYVQGKLKRDPVIHRLLALGHAENFGAVLDLGCGRGQTAAVLLAAGAAKSVTGLDCHPGLLRQASAALTDLPFSARLQDFTRNQDLPGADTVLLIDVLYQLDTASQRALLRAAANAARRRIILRTAGTGPGWRATLTRLLEKSFRRLWPNAGVRVNALPPERLATWLQERGFRCTLEPSHDGTPFSNVLILARRDAPPLTSS